MQHWDDPGNQGMPMSYDDAPKQAAEGGEEEEEEIEGIRPARTSGPRRSCEEVE